MTIFDRSTMSPAGFGTMPMAVANTGFLLERLSADCTPLQFVREFTQNAIEAVKATPTGDGTVSWGVDWMHYDQTGVKRLCCIDTGVGITGPDLVRYIGNLAATGKVQSHEANFGVGAKISAVTRNPAGLTYLSWQRGAGCMVQMRHDPLAGCYGLSRWPGNGGEFWTPIHDALKPADIDQHGTMVIFHGAHDREDTIEGPEGEVPMRYRWILRYLNQRYYRLPAGVQIRALEGWKHGRNSSNCRNRSVEGQEAWLVANSASSGTVDLGGASAHWWIVRASADRNSGSHAPCGQVAALYQNELYEMKAGSGARSLLQSFGVTFGFERVVIYVEPHTTGYQKITANTARTSLRVDHEEIDWSSWAAQFRQALPLPIAKLQQDITARASKHGHTQSILKRLSSAPELYDVRSWFPDPEGSDLIAPVPTTREFAVNSERTASHDAEKDDSNLSTRSAEFDQDQDRTEGDPQTTGPSSSRAGRSRANAALNDGGGKGDYYQQYVIGADRLGVSRPGPQDIRVTWISEETGTRASQDLAERAARYLPEQRHLIVNGDFAIFTSMVARWQSAYVGVPGSDRLVEHTVREWFEFSLLEAVLSAYSLKEAGQWSNQELSQLLSEEGLTAAILPRWHIEKTVNNTLAASMPAMRSGSIRQLRG